MSCMRGLPASDFRTCTVAQMAYTTESAPQSTINHNAVIELASDLDGPAPSPRTRPAHNKQARPAQKSGLKSAGTMPKSPPRRNAAAGINQRFSAGFSDQSGGFASIPRNGYRTGA